VVLFFQVVVGFNLFDELLLNFAELFGEGLNSALEECFLSLGLPVGVNDTLD
jgi:hypothetical protein